MHTRTRRWTALALGVLASLVVMVPQAQTKKPADGRQGCGVLIDAAHPWRSHTADGPVETEDHWITARRGRGSSCVFTHEMVHKLLALTPKTYQGRETERLFGGVCAWVSGSRTEIIRPFQGVCCTLPRRVRHRTFKVLVNAFVDPDPRFITR
jgi:hypothetical protein